MRFVYLHIVIFGFWIIANLGCVAGLKPWDPTFVVLAMVASLEAIFPLHLHLDHSEPDGTHR